MKPLSSGSDLFGPVLTRASLVDDSAWLRALLAAEAALARACARVRMITADEAAAVEAACGQDYDPVTLGQAAAASGNPVVPLVAEVAARAGTDAVHSGATSQDTLDTAMMLVAARAREALLVDLRAAADAAATLAAEHRDTPIIGRTLLQNAVPTTFGLKAAGWAQGLDKAGEGLRSVDLPAQLGGPTGTLAAYGGVEVLGEFAAEVDLAEPVIPWHTIRVPVTELAGALGTVAAVVGKIALDIVLLAQDEVAEVSEGVPGRGGSSSMPHKNNPIAAISARAAALRAPGLVATLITCAMGHEHERAAGPWHAEWPTLSDLLNTLASAVAWLCDSLENLEVDRERMALRAEHPGPTPGVLVDRVLACRGGI